jgi:hypothetical protein
MIVFTGIAALGYCTYLFYKNVIVPEQKFKAYRREKHKYTISHKQ